MSITDSLPEPAKEQWTVHFSSGKQQVFDDWASLRKLLYESQIDMANYPVSIGLVLTNGGLPDYKLGPPVDNTVFDAIYTHGLVDGEERARDRWKEGGEPAGDARWLEDVGFKGAYDQPEVDVYTIGDGPVVQIAITYRQGEFDHSTLSLVWAYIGTVDTGKVSLHRVIKDNPTRDDVLNLCDALGIEFKRPDWWSHKIGKDS